MRLTYDQQANAAYLRLADEEEKPAGGSVARTHLCDPDAVGGWIALDFDGSGRLVGVEVLAADRTLPAAALAAAVPIGRRRPSRPARPGALTTPQPAGARPAGAAPALSRQTVGGEGSRRARLDLRLDGVAGSRAAPTCAGWRSC
jgi:uncharacterized protein YuzE